MHQHEKQWRLSDSGMSVYDSQDNQVAFFGNDDDAKLASLTTAMFQIIQELTERKDVPLDLKQAALTLINKAG
jgi:hypothetical protein